MEYFKVLPQTRLTMDSLPMAISQFGLLIPSLLHKVQVQFVVAELCATVLSEVEISDLELVRIAISTPVAREQDNYQKLEFLGDSVLKFLVSTFAASKCKQPYYFVFLLISLGQDCGTDDMNLHKLICILTDPHWPEGYLSGTKDSIVSNSRLCKAALDRGLDKFILTKIFTGSKWRPMYVETLLEDRGGGTRKISSKTAADVVESLIGAGWKMGQHQTSLSIVKVFLPEVDLPSLEVGRSRLFDLAPANMLLPADLHHLESLTGYSFKKKSLLVQSMSHNSDSTAIASYERLEFLGDAILEIIVVTELIAYEDELSHSLMHLYKTTLVNGDYLSFLAMEWKIT
jgi:dsRNA-specific ribonuclease